MARRRPTETTANPARGAILVAAAVVIGLFLLRNGIDSSTTVSSDRGDVATDEGADGGTTDDEATTSTVPTVRPPAQVPTVVVNDSGVTGAAKRYSDALGTAGYQLVNPDGVTSTLPGDSAATQVLYLEGFEQEATALATAIGAPAAEVQPLGTTSPGDIGTASVVVVLGTDLANTTPTITPG
jgi:hypothetical protein